MASTTSKERQAAARLIIAQTEADQVVISRQFQESAVLAKAKAAVREQEDESRKGLEARAVTANNALAEKAIHDAVTRGSEVDNTRLQTAIQDLAAAGITVKESPDSTQFALVGAAAQAFNDNRHAIRQAAESKGLTPIMTGSNTHFVQAPALSANEMVDPARTFARARAVEGGVVEFATDQSTVTMPRNRAGSILRDAAQVAPGLQDFVRLLEQYFSALAQSGYQHQLRF